VSFDRKSLTLLAEALDHLDGGFDDLPAFEAEADLDALRPVLLAAAERMRDNYPYQHPLYAGQMLKPPHPVARLAYAMAQFVNPNNHALDGGRASSAMEREAVAEIATMFGWETHLGHLTGGGTMANMEALWVAGRIKPGKTIVASDQAHYTHGRISEVLQIPFAPIASDADGRMDMTALGSALQTGNVGTIVATMGTTGIGTTDPLPEILALAERYDCRVHVDAAYGGYFILADNLAAHTRSAFDMIGKADSIVIDPHKHGLQPYGCGCILFRDPAVGGHYKHESPYTYFTSSELHLGEISLECSRAGAAAVALWATQQALPLTTDGDFAGDLSKCRSAATQLYDRMIEDDRLLTIIAPELDIVLWAPVGDTASEISERSQIMFDDAAKHDLHLALVDLPQSLLEPHWKDVTFDQPSATCLRSCLMKSEHLDWIERIWRIIKEI
jgi:tyrosine decarboxylase / aspartate 1-decarboxylase